MYKFPRRFYELEGDGKRLNEGQLGEVLRKYYLVRGWEATTGIAGEDKLRELVLNSFEEV
mgnify:CR=1 FL=1